MSRGIFTSACPTAAELNDCYDPPRCRVYNNANIAITTATDTALTFNSESFDVGAMHSTSTNTGRITIPTGGAGTYLVQATILFAGNATGYRRLWITQNGATVGHDSNRMALAGASTGLNVQVLTQCQDGDILELYCFQDSGGNLNVVTDSVYSPSFAAMWMAVN